MTLYIADTCSIRLAPLKMYLNLTFPAYFCTGILSSLKFYQCSNIQEFSEYICIYLACENLPVIDVAINYAIYQ